MGFWVLGGCLCPGSCRRPNRGSCTLLRKSRPLTTCPPPAPLPPPSPARSFDPLGLGPKDDPVAWKELQTKELNNGRLAMIAIAAFTAQELVVKQEIFEHLALRLEKEVILELDDLERDVGIKNVSATAACALSSHQEEAALLLVPCCLLAGWRACERQAGSRELEAHNRVVVQVDACLTSSSLSCCLLRFAIVYAHTGHRGARAGAGGAEELSCWLRLGRLTFWRVCASVCWLCMWAPL